MRAPTIAGMLCAVALAAVACGCSTGSIETKLGKVRGVPDAGTPATLNGGEVRTGFRVPANSKVTLTKTAATATTPAVEVSTFDFSEPTEFEQTASTIIASTGTIDTSVAQHRIDAQERRWLLFAAIGCAIGGLVARSLLPAWPGLSNGLLIAAPLAFAAWKLAEVPAWLWLVAIGIMAVLALGYKRAEWDANKDLIPDVLQKKKTPEQ
jgi:hypothetical protein